MCSPVLAVGAGLMVAGAVAQNRAQAKSASAINDARKDELGRQQGYADQAGGVFDQALGGFTRQAQDQALSGVNDSRAKTINRAITDADMKAVPMSPNANPAVAAAMQQSMKNAVVEGRQSANAMAKFGSYGEQGMRNQMALGDSRQRLNQIAGFSQGSLNILPMELQNAGMSGASLNTFGDILGGLGGMGMGYGLYKYDPKTGQQVAYNSQSGPRSS